jgi:hypothetical protein
MYRNRKLLNLLSTIPCQNCGIQDGTVVAAHSNQLKHGKGRGIKASDAMVAALCYSCHMELDQGSKMSKEERKEFFNDAYQRTMQYLFENDLIEVK